MASRKEQNRLIKLIREDADDAWDEFFNHYEPDIRKMIQFSIYKDKVKDDINIILTEAAKESFDYVKKGKKIRSLDALVKYITRAAIIRYFDKKKKEGRIIPEGNPGEEIPSGEPGPEEILIQKEKEHILNICMKRLTKTQKMTLRLRMEDNSWAEIARIRRVSQVAISDVRDAAFKRLRECINELQGI